jgi:hypothetical protein
MTACLSGEPSKQQLIPPLAELFFARQGGTCPSYELVTSHNAAQVWAVAARLADVLDTQLIDVQPRVPMSHSESGRLPWMVSNAPAHWFTRFVDALRYLSDDTGAGQCSIPRCTGEKVALHLLVEGVTDSHDPDIRHLIPAACTGQPVLEWDGTWEVFATALFPDPRVQSLIRIGLDGVMDDYERVAERGIVGLGVERWFDPFDEHDPERPWPMCGCQALS